MKFKILSILLICLLGLNSRISAQSDYRNFPIVLTIQFHNLAMPFQDLSSNFSNIGIGIGTEISLNGDHNWAQQFSFVWYRNKIVGNGLLFYSQSVWRPSLISNTFSELKIGGGYIYSFRPVNSYKPVNGQWIPVGQKGKGMFTIPFGISLGYNDYTANRYYISPFTSYQILIVKDYNSSIPIIPETLLQFGTRSHFKYD